ncbi:hypothetical protein Taro_018288 [Colocasia esculenta]|uniref:Retrotransposon gag domain-containing protein n=1 Tax=Colocasia esculenta TaxID=4460 RepID=A0A843UTF8_COLES|nr:hypothetical protein [Colocasia esculenta]
MAIAQIPQSIVLGYNRLVDHVGIHGQRRLTEALNKDSLVRKKEYLSESSSKSRENTNCGLVSLARLRPVRGRRTRIKYVIGLTGMAEAFRQSWYQSKKSLVWPMEEIGVVEEMIRRKVLSAPVPPVTVPPGDGEAVPVAPVPPRVEVPFAAPVPPPPPVLLAEEPVMQVEKFLRLQPPTYSEGPNPDTAEHWVHEIERVFATMRCPAADRVVLAAYQLRGFALEWWRLKMQTTFAGRTEEAITWSEFLDVFNDTFFPIQVQQVKREQFRTLQQVVPRDMPQALVLLFSFNGNMAM